MEDNIYSTVGAAQRTLLIASDGQTAQTAWPIYQGSYYQFIPSITAHYLFALQGSCVDLRLALLNSSQSCPNPSSSSPVLSALRTSQYKCATSRSSTTIYTDAVELSRGVHYNLFLGTSHSDPVGLQGWQATTLTLAVSPSFPKQSCFSGVLGELRLNQPTRFSTQPSSNTSSFLSPFRTAAAAVSLPGVNSNGNDGRISNSDVGIFFPQGGCTSDSYDVVHDLWTYAPSYFLFKPTITGFYDFSTCDTTGPLSTKLALLSSCDPTDGVLGCNYNTCCEGEFICLLSTLSSIPLQANVTYYLMVGASMPMADIGYVRVSKSR